MSPSSPPPSTPQNYVLPLSMRFLRTIGGVGCTSCRCCSTSANTSSTVSCAATNTATTEEEEYMKEQHEIMMDELRGDASKVQIDPLFERMTMMEDEDAIIGAIRTFPSIGGNGMIHQRRRHNNDSIVPTESTDDPTSTSNSSNSINNQHNYHSQIPLSLQHLPVQQSFMMERILLDYHNLCRFYSCNTDIGVMTTIRYTLTTLRIASSNFNDAHLLSICDLLLKYGNGPLSYIQHFDFSRTRNRNYNNSSSAANIFFPERSPFYVVPTVPSSSISSGTLSSSSSLNSVRKAMNTGFGSHGAIALAKWIQVSKFMTELYIDRNPIGPYGASVVFLACTMNTSLTKLSARRCHVNERGAIMFVKSIISHQQQQFESLLRDKQPSSQQLQQQSDETSTSTPTTKYCQLEMVDLSANRIGYRGCIAIDVAMNQLHTTYALLHQQQQQNSNEQQALKIPRLLQLDMEGNLVLQEVMNSVTHGLGIILAVIGSVIMMNRVWRDHSSPRHIYSCIIYSISLVVLYTSSTLYHSFFTLRHTKYVFEVIDKCAIYILIAGSYTPFLQIVLSHYIIYSYGLLCFLWILCGLGVTVEFMYPIWKYKGTFSLAMFLCMGWSALICIPEVARIIPPRALHLMTMGGLSYTAGVPFFVRNNNLDHAIWHLFVLGGSFFHWCGVYFYVVPLPIR